MYHRLGASMQYPRKVRRVGAWVVGLLLSSCDPGPTDARADEHLRQALRSRPAPAPPSAGRPAMEAETTEALRRAMSTPLPPDTDADNQQQLPAHADDQQAPPVDVHSALLGAPWLVYFPVGSARSRSRDAGRLSAAARAIRRLGGEPEIEVHGHADATGDEARNVALSMARAEAVIAALRAHGVGRARLRAVAHGSSEPQVPDTPRDRWKNRRVRLVLSR